MTWSKELLLISLVTLHKLKRKREGELKVCKNKFKNILSKALAILLLSGFFITNCYAADSDSAINAYKNERTVSSVEKGEVMVGGIPFGVRFYTEGITVIGFSEVDTDSEDKSPAYNAGLRENDIIMSINSIPVGKAEDFIKTIENCVGKPLAVDYKRSGKIFSTSLTPVISKTDGKYKTGMWIKDSTAGIGTVTYVIPETKAFAGLGHSICDGATGEILKMTGGYVSEVNITGVKIGKEGVPGELKGSFVSEKAGTLKENTDVGIFGVFTKLPESAKECSEMCIADNSEITAGPAKIRCTVDSNGIGEYDVSITEIDFDEISNKNFVIEITDPKLIEKTGGIVQGMSGSPIIQSGKLIGAVTHVFINDPKKGYGIYIGNMISEIPGLLN